MPTTDLRLVAVAVVFGLVLGLGLRRWPEDRKAFLWATATAAAIGVVTLATNTDPGDSEVGLSLAIGGVAGFLTVARR